MTVRSVPANVLDVRLEAGLVCVTCGIRQYLQVSIATPPPRASRWGRLHIKIQRLGIIDGSTLLQLKDSFFMGFTVNGIEEDQQ